MDDRPPTRPGPRSSLPPHPGKVGRCRRNTTPVRGNARKISVAAGGSRFHGTVWDGDRDRGVAGLVDSEAPVERRSTKTDVDTGASWLQMMPRRVSARA